MIISNSYEKHIFCLEGDWVRDLRDTGSIKTALNFLESNSRIKFIHRTCSTREELFNRLKEYRKVRYNKYSILYLAFHGGENGIEVGRDFIILDEIGEQLEDCLKYRIVHFGSCSTLNIDKRHIKRFIRRTNALCVSGYKSEIDFIPSSILEILYFDRCQHYKDIRCVDRDMWNYYRGLCRDLKFYMVYV